MNCSFRFTFLQLNVKNNSRKYSFLFFNSLLLTMSAEILTPHLSQVRIPQKNADKIYKDECIFSFDSPESATGLYVSLKTFFGLGRDYVEDYYKRTDSSVYLHLCREKKEIPPDPTTEGPEKKITRLAIGVEGGFDPDAGKPKYEYDDHHSLVVLPQFKKIPIDDPNIPLLIQESIKAILESESSSKLAELEALRGTWDGEVRCITKHTDALLQIDNGRKIPPSGWQCEKCDLTENLWLNLTDGSIFCGRRFFDGSGGNDHAVEHYKKTGYPLAVKLRTITKEGKADVYSYDEDDMVENPNLIKHLAHFGINIQQMERTEKSMAELELDLNQKLGEWVALQEASSKLTPVYGPGYTGLANLGNSCYLNSVMQVIFTIPDFIQRYVKEKNFIIQNASLSDPPSDFTVQLMKLGDGLISGRYSLPPATQPDDSKTDNHHQAGISPIMFKSLIGKGHPDFSTKRQQDAQEFFMHFINVLERNSRHQQNPAECFKFKVEDRFECTESKKVKYNYRSEYSLPLPIPLEMAFNLDEVKAYEAAKEEAQAKGIKSDNQNIVRPKIKLNSCLECFAQQDTVEQFYSSALNKKTVAIKTTRLATFPDYLMLHLKKFTVKEDWKPIKLDVSVEMPDTLDLSALRGKGLQPGEEALPELTDAPPALVIDLESFNKLRIMGFSPDACKRALYFTENRGIEEASNWLMEHIGDADINDPFVPPGTDPPKGFEVDEEAVQMIMVMGFTRPQAVKALKATDNNIERAADWIFSHSAELDADEVEFETVSEPEFRDGDSRLKCPTPVVFINPDREAKLGERDPWEVVHELETAGGRESSMDEEAHSGFGSLDYRLVAFISHMGTSTMVGHYVCHILKDGHWTIFNDNKVALSENPPKDLGYLYLYERIKNKA